MLVNADFKPEILAPAGDRDRLDAALLYGADAVYLAGQQYGMRSAPANFDEEGMRAAVQKAHSRNCKIYVTCNIMPRNDEIKALPPYLEFLQDIGIDGIIAADFGVIGMIKQYAPRCPLHISTQFGVVNFETARMLYDMGASRVVLARELSLTEIAEIRAKTNSGLQLECFVHGAMCMSYSGRCMLSAYMTGRDANHGDCAQPCRWKYHFSEPHRPDKIWTAEEGGNGTYLFNANDLCMIEHIGEMHHAGISSFKIEGRAKAAYYVAVITNAYHAAVEGYIESGMPERYLPDEWIREEIYKVSHRPYGTGFYFGQPKQETENGGYIRDYEVVAIVKGHRGGRLLLEQRNRFCEGDEVEILQPGKAPIKTVINDMRDENGSILESACHATMAVSVASQTVFLPGSFVRRRLI